jgi:hypothetical protein
MAVKLAQTSKMPCKSWSLQALETCPGSIVKGVIVDACKGCYARTGFYLMGNAIRAREHNREDWKRDAWADDMVEALANDRYFRWFDSGDCYDLKLAKKILEVMQRTPWVNHWFPTRMGKFSKFVSVFLEMAALTNVVIRHSSDSVAGDIVDYGYGQSSTIVPEATENQAYTLCHAYSRGGKCGPCRACWSKDVPVVAYPAHGASMKKVIRLKLDTGALNNA